jgi:hypothetical protein
MSTYHYPSTILPEWAQESIAAHYQQFPEAGPEFEDAIRKQVMMETQPHLLSINAEEEPQPDSTELNTSHRMGEVKEMPPRWLMSSSDLVGRNSVLKHLPIDPEQDYTLLRRRAEEDTRAMWQTVGRKLGWATTQSVQSQSKPPQMVPDVNPTPPVGPPEDISEEEELEEPEVDENVILQKYRQALQTPSQPFFDYGTEEEPIFYNSPVQPNFAPLPELPIVSGFPLRDFEEVETSSRNAPLPGVSGFQLPHFKKVEKILEDNHHFLPDIPVGYVNGLKGIPSEPHSTFMFPDLRFADFPMVSNVRSIESGAKGRSP